MKPNCYLSRGDKLFIELYDKDTAIEYFGQDHLEEYGLELPDGLIKEYKENYWAPNTIIRLLT